MSTKVPRSPRRVCPLPQPFITSCSCEMPPNINIRKQLHLAHKSAMLEAEAKCLGAAYLVNPVKPAELLTVVSRELGMGLEPRHAPECSEPPNPMAALHQ